MVAKTSVELDQSKVTMAKNLVPARSLKELLDKALDALIAEARRNQVANMLGTEFFEGDLEAMRGKFRGNIG